MKIKSSPKQGDATSLPSNDGGIGKDVQAKQKSRRESPSQVDGFPLDQKLAVEQDVWKEVLFGAKAAVESDGGDEVGIAKSNSGYYSNLSDDEDDVDEDYVVEDIVQEQFSGGATSKKSKKDTKKEKAMAIEMKNNEWANSVAMKDVAGSFGSDDGIVNAAKKVQAMFSEDLEEEEEGGSKPNEDLHPELTSQGTQATLLLNLMKNVCSHTKVETCVFLNVHPEGSGDNLASEDGFDALCKKIGAFASSISCTQVDLKPNECISHAIKRSVSGYISPDSLVVCHIQPGGITGETLPGKEVIKSLGTAFEPFSNGRLLLSWAQPREVTGLTATDVVRELAGSGWIPASGSDCFGPNGFALCLTKQEYSIRPPIVPDDLDRLCVIDEESWEEELRYPREIIEGWASTHPKDILVMLDNNSGGIVGAMYTQRVLDGERIDSIPWLDSIAITAGTNERGTDPNIDPNGMVKQLLRVSSSRGGGGVKKFVPGTALRDFALVVSASEGIGSVYAITRARDFVMDDEMSSFSTKGDCYDAFLQKVGDSRRADRGLGFHLSGGASVVRKSTTGWLPQDLQNGGYGVLVRYSLQPNSSKVKDKARSRRSSQRHSFRAINESSIAEEVERSVKQVVGIEDESLPHTTSLFDLGIDSLSLNELATDLTTKTGGSVEVTTNTLFKRPSIASVSSHLMKELSVLSEVDDSDAESFEMLEENGVVGPKQNSHSDVQNGFAIVGMSCRFPGGVTCPTSYWELLRQGTLASHEIPFDRWDASVHASKSNLDEKARKQVSHGSFVNDMEFFDPSAFNISKVEAESMSPLQRALLECSYLTLLDAGFSASDMKGLNCGVFVGLWFNASTQGRPSNSGKGKEKGSVYMVSGSAASIASGRISYVFDFSGPNAVYDTACSSSLVALDAAISALQMGKCDMALVAGANELFDSKMFEACARAGMLSPTGRCHTWDAEADGYLRGEGCGAILLKPAHTAKPGSIYANVLGASVMSDGASASITAPNGSAQERLIKSALEAAGIEPSDVDYIEAHGTGTVLGDPIEIEALAEVFASSRPKNCPPLTVGSVKSNIGHLEGAAGIAGLIKAVLVLAHECAPPNVGLKTLNPLISKTVQTYNLHVEFPTHVQPLVKGEGEEKLLVAGVSSFGYSGTIAHAIVRQASSDMRRCVAEEDHPAVAQGISTKNDGVVFLFTGQGSQYAGMGENLYNENEGFRSALDQCESIYKTLTGGESLLDTIFDMEDEGALTRLAQPALVALEWSLAKMWQAHGIKPSIVLGHSLGEISAACVAGGMSIETAMALVVARARLVHQLPSNNGTMMAVRCSMNEAQNVISFCLKDNEKDLVGVASVNGPNSIVLSGARDTVEKVLSMLGKTGLRLQVSHAFHSPLMRGMEDEFRRVIEGLDISGALTVPVSSTVTGEIIHAGGMISVEHWVKQLASPVLFEDALSNAMGRNESEGRWDVVVECGPKPVLSKMAQTWWKKSDNYLWVHSMEQGKPSTLSESLEAISTLRGVQTRVVANPGLNSIFPNRKKFPWPETPPHPLLQHSQEIRNRGVRGTEYTTMFHSTLMEFYKDHTIPGGNLFPGAGFVEMGLAAGARLSSAGIKGGVELLDVEFNQALHLEEGCEMISEYFPTAGMEFFRKKSGAGDEQLLTLARIKQVNTGPLDLSKVSTGGTQTLEGWKQGHIHQVNNVRSRYDELSERGFHRGAFQSIESVWLNEEKTSAIAKLSLPEGRNHEHDAFYHSHPAVLDGAFQLLGFVTDLWNSGETFVPAGIARVAMNRSGAFHLQKQIWAKVTLESDKPIAKLCNIEVMDENNGMIIAVEGLRFGRWGISSKPKQHSPTAMRHTANWIERDRIQDVAHASSFAMFELSGTTAASSSLVDELGASVLDMSDLESLPIDGIPENIVVPIMGVTEEPSSSKLPGECLALLQLLHSKIKGHDSKSIHRRVCFLTRNAEGPATEDVVFDTASKETSSDCILGGGIWGMIRTATVELDSRLVSLVCMDTDAFGDGKSMADQVRAECMAHPSTAEPEISYRGHRRYVRRISKGEAIPGDVELVVSSKGGIGNLSVAPLSSTEATEIPNGNVEIGVHATGLNFKDVLNVLYPDESSLNVFSKEKKKTTPGLEFAGIVTRVPSSDENCSYSVGDRVFGIGTEGMIRSKAVVSTNYIAKISDVSFEEAATLPIVFLTVDFALGHLAGLKKGDRVLIHSAAGGVGLAAIQYARQVGAEIYATASPSKHDYLRNLGVENISTSRDGNVFSGEMGQLLGEDRFDVILSSGNLVEESLALLATGGFFAEIAKLNILSEEEMLQKRPDVRASTYTFGDLVRDKPHVLPQMLESLADRVGAGTVQPLPTEVFDLLQVQDAFHRLRSGQTVGKVAVRIQEERDVGVAIISGGLGGLGLVAAEILLGLGARHVVLVSRSGKVPNYEGQDLQSRLDQLTMIRDGTAVSIERCDMSNEDEVRSLLDHVRNDHGEINTIVHGSGILSDGSFNEMSQESLQACFGPKAVGGYSLHKLTITDNIRHFVVFSSVVSLLGNPRQANHSSSSACLDALIRLRRQSNLPGVSVQWPAIAEVGKAASLQKRIGWSESEMLSMSDTKMAMKYLFSEMPREISVFSPLVQKSLPTLRQLPRFRVLLSDNIDGNVVETSGVASSSKSIFLALGEHYIESDEEAGEKTRAYMAHRLLEYTNENPSALLNYPWLEKVLEHADVDSHEVADFSPELYDRSLQYRMAVDLYQDMPKMLSDPLRSIQLHPEHDSMYESEGFASSHTELASLLRLVCKEFHGTKLNVFEVGTGSAGLTRRAVPILDIEDRLGSFVCSDIFDIRLGKSLQSHPAISRVKYDVNREVPLLKDEKYHLILASNAVHIARNVRGSMVRLCDALQEGGMILLEESISSYPLYLHGLDKFIWETPMDERSYGLWLNWEEWLSLVDSIEELELLVWYRRKGFASMLFKKTSKEGNAAPEQCVMTDNKKTMNASLAAGSEVVFCGRDAEKVVMHSSKKSNKLRSLTTLDGSDDFDANDGLPLRFNTVAEGRLGSTVTIPLQKAHRTGKRVGTDSRSNKGGGATAKSQSVWNRHAVSSEVEQAVRSVANVSGDLDFGASLMDVGLDSLAIAELSSMLRARFDMELPAAIVFSYPTISDLTDHIFGCLTQESNICAADSNYDRERTRTPSRDSVSYEVEQAVRSVANVSGDLDFGASLMDVGLDSLAIAELSSILRARFDMELPAAIVFSYPTISDLTDHIFECLSIENNDDNLDWATETTKNRPQRAPESPPPSQSPAAIVGMSCRFPGGVATPSEFWTLMQEGSNSSSDIPFDRWDSSSLAARSNLGEKGQMQVSHGSFVRDMEFFDPSVFKIAKGEAESMSPLQRMLLECSYLALLDAGYSANEMKGLNCGVFVGTSAASVPSIRPSNNGQRNSNGSVYSATGSTASIASGRISYVFNFQGPNSVYETACSSSLVALDAAISALQTGRCDMALVAGANELFDHKMFEAFARAGMLSPTGNCHTWDATADGFLRGEGCGAILLKPAHTAKPGSIYANVLGASVMSDGASASITAPNGSAQKQLIMRTLESSGIEPSDVDYIEAHGTGTALGDPIEMTALAEVFATSRPKTCPPLMMGSVKSNIGHLEHAAGIAGLIKAVLVLAHETVPPNAGLKKLNPLIDETIAIHDFSVEFPTDLQPLGRGGDAKKLLVAGVSSFGYSGTIAHAVVQQASTDMRRSVAECDGASLLNKAFPNRKKYPWPETPPHPLLQQSAPSSKSVEYQTIFHSKILDLYSNHVIDGQVIFPAAGYVEMGLAAGFVMGFEGGVELRDIKFVRPFDLTIESKLVCNHTLGGGMEFCTDQDVVVASISDIKNMGHDAPSTEQLGVLFDRHTFQVTNIHDRYGRLAEAGYHKGAFQSIKSVSLSKDMTSALGRVSLPEGFKHDHDSYYHVHPAVLDGAFQMIGFVSESMEGEAWVPPGISHVAMVRKPTKQELWAHLVLVDNGPRMKRCDLNLFDDNGLVMSFESFRCARLGHTDVEASMYTSQWIQSSSPKDETYKLEANNQVTATLVQLDGCNPLSTWASMPTTSLSDISSGNVPKALVVPLALLKHAEANDYASSTVLEDCFLLLKNLIAKQRHADGETRQVCFWTWNSNGPTVDNAQEGIVGSSLWGMVRTASLEIDSDMLRITCIDASPTPNGLEQVLLELQNGGSVAEDVSFRGSKRFVRRLCQSEFNVNEGVELALQQDPNIGVAVITGGLGGLGLVTAELLCDIGAKFIVLVSRSGKAKKYSGQRLEERLERLLERGNVSVERCDVSNESDVKLLLERIRTQHGSVNTIVHASGLLRDGLLQNMTVQAVRSSFGAKAVGAWYLHQSTLSDDVCNFVTFSSIAAMLGNRGQANYTASNEYLDALIRLRRQSNLPGVSVQWPAVADVGMAAANEKRMTKSMADQISVPFAKKVLKHLLSPQNVTKDEAVVAAIPPSLLNKGRFSTKQALFLSDVVPSEASKGNVSKELKRGPPKAPNTPAWTIDAIRVEVEKAVRKLVDVGDSENIDHHRSLLDTGLDSLGIIELSDLIQSRFGGIELSSTFVFDNRTIDDMALHIFGMLSRQNSNKGRGNHPGATDGSPQVTGSKASQLEGLFHDESDLDHTLSMTEVGLESIRSSNLSISPQFCYGSTQDQSSKQRPRLLCLHGVGSNNSSMGIQLEGLKLTTHFEAVMVHAPHMTDCFPGLDEFIKGPYYSFADMFHPESDVHDQWDQSLEYLAKVCKERGPFDGVYAFSQGKKL
ncbi:hypothetical protein ACHAWF_018278 [Thalassiosira exigua]